MDWGKGGEERGRRRRRFGVEQPGTESLLAGRTPPSLARQRSKHLPDVTKASRACGTSTRRDGNSFTGVSRGKRSERKKVWDAVFWLFFSQPGGGGTWSLFIVARDDPGIKGGSSRGAGSVCHGVCSGCSVVLWTRTLLTAYNQSSHCQQWRDFFSFLPPFSLTLR